MRVLLITQWRPKSGGIVTHVENMMRHSACEFSILTYPEFVDIPILRALSFVLYGFYRGLSMDCDVIHAHYAVPQGFLGVLLKMVKGRPLVVTAHGSDVTVLGRGRITRPLVAFALKNADAVVAVSNFVKGEMVKMGVPEERIRVIHNGIAVDHQIEREEFFLPGNGPIVTFIGNLVPQKGVDVLLHAIDDVRKVVPDARVVIIGDGREEKGLKALARELQLNDVHFLGRRKDLVSVLEKSSLLVLPSREEGLGMVLLEAMHMGVPVVASDTGGIPEVVEDRENGILVERGNPEALGTGIITALTDVALREKLVRNGRETVKRFSWEKASSEVDSIYDEVSERAHH
ncbi:MAG: glycosyltransferase family 4 protein [Candidatus Hydrothermarchaeaceae archaeon]